MAEDWQANADEIAAEIAEDGYLFPIYRVTQGQYDPLEGEYQDSTRQDFKVAGLFQSFNSSVTFQEGFTEHSIERGDLLVLLVNNNIYIPKNGDYVEWQGIPWIVQGITISQPAGIPLTFTVSIRRG